MIAICASLPYLLQFSYPGSGHGVICSLSNPTKCRSLNYGAFNHDVYETEKRKKHGATTQHDPRTEVSGTPINLCTQC